MNDEKTTMANGHTLREPQSQWCECDERGRIGHEGLGNRIPFFDLFSGIGGFALAFESEGFISIGHAEVEPFACEIYHRHFQHSVCFGGVENVTRDSILERCGVLPIVVTGGFPCQPHSVAGLRKAGSDERDLWGECKRVLRDLRPRHAVFENVGGLLSSDGGLFFNRILSDLAEIRFACFWQIVSAADVGAPHRRERVWLVCVDELADHDGERGGKFAGQITTGTQYALPWDRRFTGRQFATPKPDKDFRTGATA